jgi:hypothetical protein
MSADGWAQLVDGLREAGERLDELVAQLDPTDRADGRRALVRALNNLLGRVEIDRDTPELAAFNGWREKFFMDNPNYRYWITDVRDDSGYQISGNIGDSVYQSITVYASSSVANAKAVARIDSDAMAIDTDGNFSVTLSPTASESPAALQLPEGSSSVWVRYVNDLVSPARSGYCRIDPLGAPGPPSDVDPTQIDAQLARVGKFLAQIPLAFGLATSTELEAPNTVRQWTAMSGGAAFTEPGIHYLRGGWQLGADEALLIEGPVIACRHWNIVLYNRFLNSLDYRRHVVSHTGATASLRDGRFGFVLAHEDPLVPGYDWLGAQGRRFGLFVMRFLQPESEPVLPAVRLVKLADLAGAG